MKLLFLMVFGFFMVANVDGVEQSCSKFWDQNYFLNSYDGPYKLRYRCTINNVNLPYDTPNVTTNTALNQRSNDDVTFVVYENNIILTFIPNSLFTTFINLEYLLIWTNFKFTIMKSEYLKNANKLKIFHVRQNEVKTLGPNLFVEAANLEHINFSWNKIESIHKLAFNGLPNLQGIYLQGNQITNLDPSTFKSITKLNILELTGAGNCLNRKYLLANQTVALVEAAISESCAYNLFCEDSRAIEEARKLAEEQKLAADLRVEEEKLKVTELEEKLKLMEKNQQNACCEENHNKLKSELMALVELANQKNEMQCIERMTQIAQNVVERIQEQKITVDSLEERLNELHQIAL